MYYDSLSVDDQNPSSGYYREPDPPERCSWCELRPCRCEHIEKTQSWALEHIKLNSYSAVQIVDAVSELISEYRAVNVTAIIALIER